MRTTRDVQRALGIDTALAWQLFRVGSLPDPVAAGPDVPRPGPLSKALRAAAARGVSQAVIQEVRQACDEFERLVERHAGDRALFDSMVRGLRRDTSQIPLRDRREAYRTNTSIWGLQAQTTYVLAAYYPNRDGRTEDRAALWGYVGMRSLRMGPPAHVVRFRAAAWSSEKQEQGQQTPVARNRVDMFTEFSTKPLPPIHASESEPGALELTFSTDVVGRSGEATYFLRDIAERLGESPQPWWGMGTAARIPSEFLIMDLLVPAGWCDPGTARVDTYCNFYDRASKCLDEDRMPIQETIAHLGQDLLSLRSPHVDDCPEMVAEFLRGQGLENTRFDIFRCVVQYPVMFSGVVVRVDAPAARRAGEGASAPSPVGPDRAEESPDSNRNS